MMLRKGDSVILDPETLKQFKITDGSFFDLKIGTIYKVREAMEDDDLVILEGIDDDYGSNFFRLATPAEITATKIAA